MIPYGKQSITPEDIEAVVRVLQGDFLTQGPEVDRFENLIQSVTEAPHAVAVANGTAALHLVVMALGIKPGQKVICPPLSFVASANCVLYAGGCVEFVDIDPKTLCLDPQLVEEKLKSAKPGEYAGVITVDFAGYPSSLRQLKELTSNRGIWLLEDSCHALGAEYFSGRDSTFLKAGSCSHADAAIFSFHPVKHIAAGEGGMVTTAHEKVAKRVKLLRTHGITKDPKELTKNEGPWFYEMQELGFNYRMPDILCALASSQLGRLAKNLERRREIANRYALEFKNLPLTTPETTSEVKHAWHLYVIQTEKRAQLFNHLRANGIAPQVHYIPIHTQPYYVKHFGKVSMPCSEQFYSRALSLPMYHGMNDQAQDQVIRAVKSFYE
ncbi:MAG: UDP-4-amino-4,6-dideoxy-N-acetyl-beta-L-altrosamine transaminase [Proteobacteria bacterium]|nr:UDP-4-amino-4,6-dideoxy-N-acetyl-beta-L-altrosamine transaminase [Pseudomonadota bacterium]NDC23935.1 UDP-4-amino-4,6-dideoxy-N-acetyl-beta-L-altrosamine transaminase [Pseudomonadota bacterium]NDD03482.1 UDP-4-amino-4,6-dideoxy-N-acetyl-beta-L-altrosamine transaminase [Pseudomonadota bacterium]NDG26294.1 UDP-4-amino-4,6-dideoxy-N-acetyl-beta-L-altrosamine transaminase [Pseudomonadota bacterium]